MEKYKKKKYGYYHLSTEFSTQLLEKQSKKKKLGHI